MPRFRTQDCESQMNLRTDINEHVTGGPYPEKMLLQLSWFADGIELAVSKGWNQNLLEDHWHVHANEFNQASFCYPRMSEERTSHIDCFTVLYDHGFAQAIWGYGDDKSLHIPEYMHHLQQMVTNPDPLRYLHESAKA